MELREDAARRFRSRIAYLSAHRDRLTIDGDVHVSDFDALPAEIAERVRRDPNYFHGRPLLGDDLVPLMDLARVDMALCWQNPAVLPYGTDRDGNAAALFEANARIAALAQKHPTRVIPAGWTDPKALGIENAIALARRCVCEFGFPVVKMNPAQNAYPITDPMVIAVVDAIVETGAVPAFHFGSDTPYTPTAGLVEIAERHPDHPLIGVHMGGGGGHFVESESTYQSARAAGLRHPNIFYVLSAKRDVHIESALITYAGAGEPFCRNVGVASDAPYGNMIWNFGAFRALFDALGSGERYGDPRLAERPHLFGPDMIAGFMGRNLADLIIAADRRILARSEAATAA